MEKGNFLKSKLFKFILPLLIVAGIVLLWQRGYAFGKWLFVALH